MSEGLTPAEREKLVRAGLIRLPAVAAVRSPAGKAKAGNITERPKRYRSDSPPCEDNDRLLETLKRIVSPAGRHNSAGNEGLPKLYQISLSAGLNRSTLGQFIGGRILVLRPEKRARVWAVLREGGWA